MTTQQMSGSTYIPMRLRGTEDRATPTKILSSQRCEHKSSICKTCANEWEIDYEVLYKRTRGGRMLAAQIGKVLE